MSSSKAITWMLIMVIILVVGIHLSAWVFNFANPWLGIIGGFITGIIFYQVGKRFYNKIMNNG